MDNNLCENRIFGDGRIFMATQKSADSAKDLNFTKRAVMKKGLWSISVPKGFEFSDDPKKNGISQTTGNKYELIIAKPFRGKKVDFDSPYENEVVFVVTHAGKTVCNGESLPESLSDVITESKMPVLSVEYYEFIIDTPKLKVFWMPSVANMFFPDQYTLEAKIVTPNNWSAMTVQIADLKNKEKWVKTAEKALASVLTPDMSDYWDDSGFVNSAKTEKQDITIENTISSEPDTAPPDIELYPHYSHLRSRGSGLFGITVVQSSRGTQFECLPVKGLLKDKKAEQHILATDTEQYTLYENAKNFSAIFSVSKESFNSEDDRENDILNANLKKIEALHVLRSFSWSLMSYCKKAGKDIKESTISEIKHICKHIEQCNYLNYEADSHFSTLCGAQDLHVAFLPDKVSQADKNIFLPSEERLKEYKETKQMFPTYNEILTTVASLDGLRAELNMLLPVMDKLAEELMDSRDYEKPLDGTSADVLYAWCTLAMAAKGPFYTEDGPMMCGYSWLGTVKPKKVKNTKADIKPIPEVTEDKNNRSFYNADIYNMLEKYTVPESRTKLLRQLKNREQLDNPPGCDLMIKKFIRPEESTLLEKAYIQYNKFDDAKFYNEITAAAKEFAEIFRVNPEIFNPEYDTEAEIYSGYIKHISAIHALKSLATMVYPYAKKVNKDYSNITIEEIYNMVYLIEDCGGSNFKSQAARGEHWLQYIRDVAEVKYDYRCFDSDEHFKKDYIKKDFTLLGIINDLYEMMPLMRKIYEHLSENRDRSVHLKSTLAKILSAWCTYALATDAQFEVVKGIDSYSLSRCEDSVKNDSVLYSTTEDGIVYYNNVMLDYIGDNKTLTIPSFIKSIPYDYVPFGIAEHIRYMSSETTYGRLEESKITAVEIAKDTEKLDFVLSGNGVVTKVILPDGLQEIGSWCFHDCSELQSVNIPDTVKTIKTGSFTRCEKLEVTIPASVEEISISPGLLKSFTYLKGVKAYRDSYAAKWLEREKISFETILSEEQKEADRLKAIREAEERERKRKLEEEYRRVEAERKRREEEARIAKEKRIAAERKAAYEKLVAEKEEQLKVIAENKGLFGQKAKNRKEAKKRLDEILLEMEKYPELKTSDA